MTVRSLSSSFASSFLTTSRCACPDMRSFSSTTNSEYAAFSNCSLSACSRCSNDCVHKRFLRSHELQRFAGNHIKPTHETLRLLQSCQSLVCFQECILRNFLSDVEISDFPPHKRVNLFLILFSQAPRKRSSSPVRTR